MSGNEFIKRKKTFAAAAGSVHTPPTSRGGSGGAPDHSAIQLDGDVSSYSSS